MVNISIIIPVYNVENYLTRCLDSVYNQEFSGSFEVIAVEDCSTDNSLKKLREYKLENPELVIIEHKENKRLAQARTSGMKIAKGDYIMHVDSDDWLLPKALQSIFDKCTETNADVLVYDYIIKNEKGEQLKSNYLNEEIITTNKLDVQKYFYGACWTKIVKNKLVNNMVYSNTEAPRSTEDLIYCTEILLRAETICLFPLKFYGYFLNSSSITQTSNPKKYLSNQIIIAQNLYEICKKYNPSIKIKNSLMDYFSKFLFLSIAKTYFYNIVLLPECQVLLGDIIKIPFLDNTRILKIKKAMNNKYYSLFQVARRFSLRFAGGIAFRSFRNTIK